METLKQKIQNYVDKTYNGSLRFLSDKVLLKFLTTGELAQIKSVVDKKIQEPTSLMIWCFLNDTFTNPQCVCGKDLKFNTTRKTFGSFCSPECRYSNPDSTVKKRKETCIERYGATNYLTSEEGLQRTKDACLERYGEDSFFKTEIYKQFRKNQTGS